MAFQVGSACYDTAAQAAQAQASSLAGGVVVHGSAAYVVGVSAVSDTSITYTFAPVGGGATISQVAAYDAQPCNLLTGADGLTLGWAVAAAWLATWAVMFLARALRGPRGEGDGYGDA